MSEETTKWLGATSTAIGVADEFRRWAVRYANEDSPFLAALSIRCADDEELMALAGEATPGQPQALIFFGAVHSLVLANPTDQFGRHFGIGSMPLVADDATFAALKDFCRRWRSEIIAILKRRTVQITRQRRANFVLPLLGHLLQKGVAEPFSLVEIGCSAGLLTVFDNYYFDFGAYGRLGDPAYPDVGAPSFAGNRPPIPAHMPKIAERFGVDLNPVDPLDPSERIWMEGLVAPDAKEERRELREALDARAQIPLETIKGDAMRVLPELLPKLKHTSCVLHSFCIYQWSAELQNELHEMLRAASRARTIYRVGVDLIRDLPGRKEPRTLDPAAVFVTDMVAVTYTNGDAAWEHLGASDGLGRHIKWLA